MAAHLFDEVALAPRDPILGLNEAFAADQRPTKVNLGMGVYSDENGKVPLLAAVRQAENSKVALNAARSYLPIDGIPGYNLAVQKLLFGEDSDLIVDGRAVTIQALGGTGALKVGADFLRQLEPHSEVHIGDPSWENHRALFEAAGFKVSSYPYYDAATHGVKFDAWLSYLKNLKASSIVVLHACCHNPTGVDPTPDQWDEIIKVIVERDLIAFADIAYQGFGAGIYEDAAVIRKLVAQDIDFFVASSFSKSFSLYGERVGALTVVTSGKDQSSRVLSQLKRTIRTNYSSPPSHGASIVSMVLNTPELRATWESELAVMRTRIKRMRERLVALLDELIPGRDFSFIAAQNGMFSYSGLTSSQVEDLQVESGIYAVSTGRICVASLNDKNIEYVAKAIAHVVGEKAALEKVI
jgi:aromatic-amino-acid transaminase